MRNNFFCLVGRPAKKEGRLSVRASAQHNVYVTKLQMLRVSF